MTSNVPEASMLEFHRYADIFPLLETDELTDLARDIQRHGLREPVTLFNGQILDGRNRWRACRLAGIQPQFKTFEGTDAEALALVVSLNLRRRHLNESQRAMVAARLATLGKGRPAENASIEAFSQEQAAELLSVSRSSVQRAREVIESGDPELAAAVDRGELRVSAAAGMKGYDRATTSFEWYTPPEYVEAARRALGGIDLDPASCAEANETIKAERYFTREDDGLGQEWHGRVWMNPPYGEHTPKFVTKLVDEYNAGRVKAAVVLLNSFCVTTKYFRPLWEHTLCFARERIGFYKPGGEQSKQAINGTVFVYLGPNPEDFALEFADVGPVVRQWMPEAA